MITINIEDFRDTDTPYQHAVENILFGNPNRRLINFNVWWGPDGEPLPKEEIYKAIYDMLTSPGEVIENIDEHVSSITEIDVQYYIEGVTAYHSGAMNPHNPWTIECHSFERGRFAAYETFRKKN